MKGLVISILLVHIIFYSTHADAESTGALESVYRPTFESIDGEKSAGKGFVTKYDDMLIFITALHLIGEAGGFPRDYNGDEIANVVGKLTARNLDNEENVLVSNKVITLQGTEPSSDKRLNGDVAAFLIEPGKSTTSLPLSAAAPKQGERLFMLSTVYGSEEKRHQAFVVESSDDYIAYVFEDKSISLAATSGAPLINERGEVVAINISGGEAEGYQIGFGNPSKVIIKYLDDAIEVEN